MTFILGKIQSTWTTINDKKYNGYELKQNLESFTSFKIIKRICFCNVSSLSLRPNLMTYRYKNQD